MKTILITAYAVNPTKGSEDGTGWNLVCEAAKSNPVIVITRQNNQKDIERYIEKNPAGFYKQMSFVYFDLPYWMRFWKKGQYLALIYFYMWQMALPFFIRKKKLSYDVLHHLNFHNDWTPSFLWILNKPLVWGPIGHHPAVPYAYLKPYGRWEVVKDRMRWYMKKMFWHLDPFLRITEKKANTIITINSASLPYTSNVEKFCMPAVGCDIPVQKQFRHIGFKVLSVGRFVPLKGFDITVSAFAHFVHALPEKQRGECKLTLVGKGPWKNRIQEWIKEYKIEKYTEIIEWVPREKMNQLYATHDVFLFPSHEGAGMVIPEALAFGLPVICFRNNGPGELTTDECAIRVPYSTYEKNLEDFSRGLNQLYNDSDLRAGLSQQAKAHVKNALSWERKGSVLKQIYQRYEYSC